MMLAPVIPTDEDSGPPREIWLFDDAPIQGGAELFALRLARFAAQRGAPMRIVCPEGTELAAAAAGAGAEHVAARFPPVSPTGAPHWPSGVLGIRSLLRRSPNGAIAVANTSRSQAYVAAAAALLRDRPPVVHVLHEQATLRRVSGRFAFRRLGGLVAIGDNVAAAARAALPQRTVTKANNFLDPGWFRDGLREPPPGGEPVVGVLARLIPEKGVLELVEELARCTAWSRAVIGGDAQDPAYARRVGERIGALGLDGRVTLAGRVALEDVPGFLASIDVLAVPSTGAEAQPTVILEALAAGRPSLVRPEVWSADFEGLPVGRFASAEELESRLASPPAAPAPVSQLRACFGPEQAIEAIVAAAEDDRA